MPGFEEGLALWLGLEEVCQFADELAQFGWWGGRDGEEGLRELTEEFGRAES